MADKTVKAKIKPLNDRVVVRRTEGVTKNDSPIYIPDAAKEKSQEGVVVAVGKGRLIDGGTFVPLDVKVGDTVIFSKFAGAEFKVGEETLLILSESDIFGVIENGK